jgi:hypothetical protein
MNRVWDAFRLGTRLGCGVMCLAATAGCARTDRAAVVPVEGRVLIDGKPAAAASVTFHPLAPGEAAPRPVGQAGADGRFALTSFAAGDGAPPGEYRVTVVCYRAAPGRRASEGDDAPPRNLLPDRYARPDTTPLRATVGPAKADPVTFDLKRR